MIETITLLLPELRILIWVFIIFMILSCLFLLAAAVIFWNQWIKKE